VSQHRKAQRMALLKMVEWSWLSQVKKLSLGAKLLQLKRKSIELVSGLTLSNGQ
jgi:hypothetical protein